MAAPKRRILGTEILKGLRQLKRGGTRPRHDRAGGGDDSRGHRAVTVAVR